MKRHYYSQGKQRDVEQIEGVLAVLVPLDQPSRSLSSGADPLQTQNRFNLDRKELEPFTRSGWRFLDQRIPELDQRDRSASSFQLPEGISIGTVFRSLPDGQLLIGTDRLSIKLDPLLPEAAAKAKLEQLELKTIRQLRFAPNLFLVEIPPHSDVLDIANQLIQDPQVVYAEPEMIGHQGHRAS